jgi:hypothetical protein
VRARERWNGGSNGIVTTSFELVHLLLAHSTQPWTSWSRPRPTPMPSADHQQSIQSYQNDVAEARAFPTGAVDWVKLCHTARRHGCTVFCFTPHSAAPVPRRVD